VARRELLSGASQIWPELPGPVLPEANFSDTLKAMEVHFTPEQEAQLSQIATNEGTGAERLRQDARFRAAVLEGIAQADRGEFIEEEEMDARLERMLSS
jgi:predicted transcriptional regulator